MRTLLLSHFLRALFSVTLLLVGSLQSSVALAALTTPTTDFTDNGDGTVTHQTTGLTWKRCAEGLVWNGSACLGTVQRYTWAQGKVLTGTFAGKNDWRLPTATELITIIEHGKTYPAINATIFPNTPQFAFLTATVNPFDPAGVWIVSFDEGRVSNGYKSLDSNVRLVRGSLSSLAHGPDCLFNWAEGNASTIFAPVGWVSQTAGNYYYRYYSLSDSYLASSSDGNVYYADKKRGLVNLGPLTQWYATAGCQP